MQQSADEIERRRRQLLATLRSNAGINPDQEAREQNTARRLNTTPEAVRAAQAAGTPLPPQLRFNLSDLPQRSPRAASWLSQPNNARVAHDDTDNLVDAEDVLRAQGNFAGQQLVAPPRRAPTFGNILRGLGSAVADAFGPNGSTVTGIQLFGERVLEAVAPESWRDPYGRLAISQTGSGATQRQFDEAQARVNNARPDIDGFGGMVYGGVESFARTAPALVASIATRSRAPALLSAGAQTFGEAFGRYSGRGATLGEATAGAAGEAAVEVLTEVIPISKMLDMVGADNFKSAIADWAKSQFADQIGEQIATAAQDAIDTAIANPDKTWAEYWQERPNAALQTAVATFVQGTLSAGTIGGANLVTNVAEQRRQRSERQKLAEQQATFAENLNRVAEASRLRERSPASFEQFIEEATADGPVENIYVDAAVFNQSVLDAGADLEALSEAIPGLVRQFDYATLTEGDLQIPVASFAAHIAGTDLGKALIDHIRVDPTAPSRAEVQTAGENAREQIRAEVERMLAAATRDEESAQSVENVKQELLAELNRAGRFTPQVNEAYASWVSAFYATRAAALGITPEEMARRFGLRVTAEAPRGADTTLEQKDAAEASQRGILGRVMDALKGGKTHLSPQAQTEAATVETVRLVHLSSQTGLTETDPSQWGASSATSNAERERARGGVAPGRTYFYRADDFRPEHAVSVRSPFYYETSIPADALYDFDADPQNLREGRDPAEYEAAIRDAGFKGYRSDAVVRGAVAVFEPWPLNQFGPIREWQQFHALRDRMEDLQHAERMERVRAKEQWSDEIVTSRPLEDFRDQAMRELFGTGAALEEQLARYAMVEGAPKSVRVNGERLHLRPTPAARDAAFTYMAAQGLQYEPPRQYAKVDVARAKRIAEAFDQMQHAPDDPLVRASYRAMIEETLAQYQFIKATGLEISLMVEGMEDPYAASPRLATEDVRNNNHLWVYPTDFGFGGPNASDIDISGNPLLEWTDEYIGDRRLRANDVFRIVHDYFGHVKDGFGFRADGEENAWQSHAAMYTPLARRAMTTETRGQNSWVNFGPYGEKNRTASASETEYAPQKIGLLPEWVSEEGFLGGPNSGVPVGETREPSAYNQETTVDTNSPEFKAWFGDSKAVDENGEPLVVYHGTPGPSFDAFSKDAVGVSSVLGATVETKRHGFYFAEEKHFAEVFSQQSRAKGKGEVMPAYLSVRNPLDVREANRAAVSGMEAVMARAVEIDPTITNPDFVLERIGDLDFWEALDDENGGAAIIQAAKELGYDGIRMREEGDGTGAENVWVVFEPTQIKSVNNRGTFDPNDPVIYNQETAVDTNSPAFRAWFGDSKAVDENGDPLVVYHGTPDGRFLTGEDARFKGSAERWGMAPRDDDGAFWFTPSRATANSYADDRRAFDYQNAEAGVFAFYVSLQNPLIVDGGGKEWREAQARGKTSDVIDEARAGGHDGVIIRNVKDDYNNNARTRATDTYVVFDPTQIKSVNNRGTFDPNDPVIYNQSDAPTNPPFYSALKRAVEESKTAKAPASQWKATLAKTPGVKAEEIEWTGLNEWLDMQEGSVERAAIIRYLDAGGIQLEEVELGGDADLSLVRRLTEQAEEEMFDIALEMFEDNERSEYRIEEGENEDGDTVWQVLHSDEDFDPESGDSYESAREARRELHDRQREEAEEYARNYVLDNSYDIDARVEELMLEQESGAQYSEWKLPGADETYREFLLKLPVTRSGRFQSSEGHFDGHDDVIAHARFTTRRDVEGRRILFLEEVQSTHHETGRERGYKGSVPQEEIDRLRAAVRDAEGDTVALWSPVLEAAKATLERTIEATHDTNTPVWEAAYQRLDVLVNAPSILGPPIIRQARNALWVPAFAEWRPEGADSLLEELRAAELRETEARNKLHAALAGVEPAPWTKSWSQLVMKRMIRYAVDNDLDGVAWINGNQQNGGQTGGDGAWFYERNLVNETNAILKKLGSRVEKISFDAMLKEVKVEYEELLAKHADMVADEVEAGAEESAARAYADEYFRLDLGTLEDDLRPAQALGDQNGFYLTDKIREQAAQGFTLFQPKRGQIAFGKDITLTPSTITLLRTSDLTTFLHETGHFFLEVDAYIASQPDAPEQIKADFQKLLDWFGVKDIATWNAMTVDQKRPHHERFARGMEMYLLEGRAPTLGLAGLFRRFSAWVKAAYKSLTDLNVELTDEVRGVMDRMVASQEAIAEAEAAYNLRPFASERPTFMSEEQWAEYQSLFVQATAEGVEEVQSRSVRDMKWLSNAKSKVLKKLQREANAQRRLVKAEVTEEVRNEPVYRAMRFLSHGVDADGNPIENAGKLDLDTLIAEYGDIVEGQPAPVWSTLRRGGRYGLVGTGGIHPDVVADLFGFASGDALIRALAEAEDINQRIAGLTDSRMLERFGDLADERAIEDAANLAVANDARIRVLQSEYAALAKATGQPRALAAAAREHAARIVNGMPLKTLKPYHFFNAAARAGRNAEKAIRSGDLAQAATHKRNQIVNLQAAREVIKAKDEVNKAAKLFTRIITAKDDVIAKQRDMAMVNAARGILGRYGISRSKNDPLAELEKVKRYDPELYADMTVFIKLMPTRDTDYMSITFEEFVGLRDNVQMLWKMSRASKQVEIDGQLRELLDVSNEMGEVLDARGIPADRPGQSRAPTDRERFGRGISGFKASLRRVESWVRTIDNGDRGPWRKYLWQPVSEAADRYRAESARYLLRFAEIVKPIEADLGKRTKIAAPEIGYTFNTKAELLHAILHTGNMSNKSKLLLGRGWGSRTDDGELDTSKWDSMIARLQEEGVLTKAHYDVAQAIWNLLEDTKPAAQRAHHKMYGRYFAEVTADPFETPWGEYAGGYVPATTDSFLVSDAAIREEELAFQESSSAMFPAASNGFTKSRVEDYTRELALDMRLLPMHIDKVLRFSHLGPVVKDVSRILRQNNLAPKLEAFDPAVKKNMLLPWLQRAANQTVSTPIAGEGGKLADKFFRELRSRTGLQLMFANVSNVLQQTSGIFSAAVRVKKGYLAQAMWQYTRAPHKTSEAVASMSEFMANRMTSQMYETRQALEEMLLNPNKYEKLRNFAQRHGYFAQMFYQNIMDVVVWTAAYNQHIANGRSDEEAIRIANSVIRETQNSMSPEDISRFETGTSFARLFTQFYSHFNNQANMLGTEVMLTRQSNMGIGKKVGRYSYLFLVGFVAQAAVADAIAQLFRGGWEDEDEDGYLDDLLAWFFASQVKYAAAMVPVAGPTVNAALAMTNKNPADDRVSLSPAISMYEGGIRAPVEVGKTIFTGDEFTRRDIRDTLTLLGMLTNLPLGFFGRPLGYAKDVIDGKVEPTGPVDAARGAITGTPSPESKK